MKRTIVCLVALILLVVPVSALASDSLGTAGNRGGTNVCAACGFDLVGWGPVQVCPGCGRSMVGKLLSRLVTAWVF